MLIRIGSVDELKLLWENNDSPTQKYFIDGIKKDNIEFWTIENDKEHRLIGELYIIWDSEDKDEANGINRAYLCAFRVDKKFIGLGLGKSLIKRVLQRITEKGFSEVTIGTDNDNADRLSRMYKLAGFSELVKLQNIDHHYLDINGDATYYEIPYALYLNKLK